MKQNKLLLSIFLLLTIVTGCTNILNEEQVGTITFASSSQSRAAVSAEQLTNVILTGINNGIPTELGKWNTFTETKNAEIKVLLGTWDFTLEASYKDIKYKGTIQNKIIKKGNNTLVFKLEKEKEEIAKPDTGSKNKTTIANFGTTYKKLASEPKNANKTIEIEITEPVITLEDWTSVATALNKVENNVYVSLKTTLGNFTRTGTFTPEQQPKALKGVTFLNSTGKTLEIPLGTFSLCPAVESITILGNNITVKSGSLTEIKKLKTFQVYGDNTILEEGSVPGNTTNINITGKNCNIAWMVLGSNFGTEVIEELIINGQGTTIANQAFSGSKIKSIKFQEDIKNLNEGLFNNCPELISVQLPKTLESIGANAFNSCTKLSTITIPETVTKIDFNAFYGCSELTTITLPSKITTIPNGLFNGCSKLSSIIIPANVTSIGNNAFYLCSALTSIEIPANVTNIGTSAFASCTNLASVTFKNPNGWILKGTQNTPVPEGTLNNPTKAAEYLKTNSDKNFVKENTALTKQINYNIVNSNGEKLSTTPTEYSINTGLTLPAASDLETVTIPSNAAVKLEWHKFSDLSDAAITKLEVSECENQATLDLYGKITYTTPVGTASDGITALYNSFTKVGTYSVELTDTITTPELWNTVKTALTQPADKTGVNVALSVGFEGLTTTDKNTKTAEGGITTAAATTAATAVTEVIILPGTTTIGDKVFQDFTNLHKVTLDGSVTNCGNLTFDGCSLSEINYKGTLLQWCTIDHHYSRLHPPLADKTTPEYSLIIDGKEITTEVTIPKEVTTLSSGVFKNCHKITTIILPDTITSAGVQTFSYCKGLITVNIPTTLTEIPEKMFYACESIQSINVPTNITKFGTSAFGKCTGLTEITLNDGLKRMNGNIFEGCTALPSLTIPKTVNYIGNQFVNKCDNLTSITFAFPTGWTTGGTSIDLSTPSNNATMLKGSNVGSTLENKSIK